MMDNKMEKWGRDNLVENRCLLNLTQKKMAEVLRVSIRTYQKWEGGENPVPGPVATSIDLMLRYKSAIKYLLGKHT